MRGRTRWERRPRRSQRQSQVAMVEHLEARCLLDGGGFSVSPPMTFGTEDAYRQYLIDIAVAQWRDLLGKTFPQNGLHPILVGTAPGVPLTGSVPAVANTASHSDTNTQVSGVDEADLVENDGQYLYILSGQTLSIVDTRQPDALAIASNTSIEGRPLAVFLDGTILTVLSQHDLPPTPYLGSFAIPTTGPGGAAVVPPSTPPQVNVITFDVSDRTAPKVLSETKLDGNYLDSRAVGDRVEVVIQNDSTPLPGPEVHTDGTNLVYETETDYRAGLATLLEHVPLPQFTTTVPGPNGPVTTSGPIGDFSTIYKPPVAQSSQFPSWPSLLTVLTFDTQSTKPGPAGSASVVASGPATVYATPDHLYAMSTQWNVSNDPAQNGASTLISKFSFNGDQVVLTANGAVPGTVLNQFSVDEQGGYLRLVTTQTQWLTSNTMPGTVSTGIQTTNNLFVLSEQDGLLNVAGTLDNLAPGERLYAARFFGDRAYLVTFKAFDPLFTIDLSDPLNPKVAGELQLPGFSRYLQPIDATHLIGIGQLLNAANNEPQDVQVSLFDVSDLANPRQVDVYTISTSNWYWMATMQTYDHHQVTYDPETQVLSIPVNGFAAPGSDPNSMTTFKPSLFVFKIDPAQSITLLGTVDDSSQILRSAWTGDTLFSIAWANVKAVKMLDPSTVLSQVALPHSGTGLLGGFPRIVPILVGPGTVNVPPKIVAHPGKQPPSPNPKHSQAPQPAKRKTQAELIKEIMDLFRASHGLGGSKSKLPKPHGGRAHPTGPSTLAQSAKAHDHGRPHHRVSTRHQEPVHTTAAVAKGHQFWPTARSGRPPVVEVAGRGHNERDRPK